MGCWGQERFSDWYVESLRGVMEWEAGDVARMESALRKDPKDLRARLQLMAFTLRGDQGQVPGSLERRVRHVLWLVENAPESEILRSPYARFYPRELNDRQLEQFKSFWRKAKGDAATLATNASAFFAQIDADEHWKYLVETVRLSSGNAMAIRELAGLCAVAIGEGADKRARALKVLSESVNPWLLSNTAHQMYLRGVDGYDGYFLRAKMLEPSIRQEDVFPTLVVAPKKQEPPRPTIEFEKTRRLPVDRFSELPAGLRALLQVRGCTVPQTYAVKKPHNVIRGEFVAKDEVGWAILCSAKGASSILVFRNDQDLVPMELGKQKDDLHDYPRIIQAVDRKYMVRSHRTFGGPKLPPIEHQGIEEGILEKAAHVWYFHAGKWISFTSGD